MLLFCCPSDTTVKFFLLALVYITIFESYIHDNYTMAHRGIIGLKKVCCTVGHSCHRHLVAKGS